MKERLLLWKRATFAVLLTLLLSAVGVTNAMAQTFTVGNLNYSLNDDGASVTVIGHVDGQNASGELVIPESVDYYSATYTVTIIGDNAFSGCNGLTGSLIIPETITSIGANAFNGCSGFTGDLTIPNSVTYIGTSAFSSCSGFTGALTIGTSLSKTGRTVFSYCNFTTLNYNAVSCYLMDVHVYIGALISIYEGNWNGSFWYNQYSSSYHWLRGCNSFVNLNIGDGVTKLPYCFLDGCSSFTGNLVIPESVTTIEWNAFNGCSGFTGSLTIPQSVTTLDNNAFANCNGFTALNFNAANCTSMSSSWLEGVTSITTLNIGESVQRIPVDFVNGKTGITGSLTIPNSVTYIGANAFSGCSGFSGTLTIGNSVTQIGNSAFFGTCEGFTSFDVKPETPPTLGTNVFTSANFDMPVLVPCGSLDSYNNASGWDVFTNIQEPNPCMWDITATAAPSNGGTITGAGVYEQGSTCTLTATPNEGISFVNWTEDGVEVSTDAEYSFTVEGNRNLVAHFIIPVYTITAAVNPSGAGTISGGATICNFEDGQIPSGWNNNLSNYPWTVTTPAYGGYNGSFCMMSGNGGFSSTTSAIEVTVDFDEDGTVSFLALCMGEGTSTIWDKCQFFIDGVQQFNYGANVSGWNRYTYEVSAGTHTFEWSYSKDSTVDPTGDAFFVDDVTFGHNYYYGDTCTLTATPSSENYVFVNWTEDGEVVSNNAQYSFVVTGDRDLVANFVQIRFEVVAWANPEEGGTVEGEGFYTIGQTCTLTAMPNEGYNFLNWTENGEEVTTETSFSFTVAGNRELVANFDPIPYTITATANPTEGGTVGFDEESSYDFDNGSMQGWTSIDADGDGYNWVLASQVAGVYLVSGANITGYGHNASYDFMVSGSWTNVSNTVLYPDNYLVSPQVQLGGSITFYACAQDASYSAEHFGVAVSTNSNTNPNDFTTIQEWTLSAKGSGAPIDATRSGNRAQGNWYEYTVDLNAYVGQSGYVAIRHFNCSDMFCINIDDISILPYEITTTYTFGSTCTLTATPSYGYALESWTENGNVVSNDEVYSFTVTGDVNLVANFVKVPFSITATPNFEDWGTVSGAGEYVIDTTCTLTATPAEGHTFVRWLENGEVVSTDAEYTFTVAGPRDLVAVFSPMEGTYIVFADPNVEAICVNNWDTDSDGFLSYDEAAAVTDLGWAFQYNDDITSFDELQYFIGLTILNEYEFYSCDNLTSMILPESITSINYYAFYNCYSLGGTLTINENVTYVGYCAFGNTNFSTLNYNAVNCEWDNSAYGYENYSLTSLNIGENVEVIPYAAFEDCYNVTGELVIPNSVTYIGAYAFEGCSGFTSITIPEGITSIEVGAFGGCSGVVTINLPSTLENIDEWAFNACGSLTNVEFPNSVVTIGFGAFQECSSLASLTLPESLEYIGNQAFYYCSSLTGALELPANVTYIGNFAFAECSNLTSLVLPENVVSIGNTAFQNCSGLRGEITLPETLESVGNHAFDGCDGISTVNYNAINCQTMGSAGQPVFYDCAFSHLRIGENVENIPDFAFKHCFLITEISSGAVVPPTIYSSTFGMVSRSIPVHVPVGSSDAYRNAPYWEEFFNITEDYSPSQYTNHWNADPNQFESNMTVIGVIQVYGEEQATDALEIGAFFGDECRGSQMLAYYPGLDRYMVFLTLHGEMGDLLTFRLYDHEANAESPLGCATYLPFVTDTIVGSMNDPYVFNFTNMQASYLPQGWTWYSTYVEQDDINGLEQLEQSLGGNGLIIKSQADGYVTYTPSLDLWYGSLNAIDNESAYLINTTESCVVNMVGATATPSDHPIILAPGWNWIGYPCATSMDINTALSGLEPMENDMLKAQEGFSVYHPQLGWIGALHTLNPSMGLMYRSYNSESTVFVYPDAARSEGLLANVTSRGNHWEAAPHAYSQNMSVIAVVELDGTEQFTDNYELAAFANGECRGSARLLYVESLDRYMAFLTVAGEDVTELYFGLYNTETEEEVVGADQSVNFSVNAVLGSVAEPYVVSFRGTTAVDEWARSLNVYPNPVEHGQAISLGNNETGEVRVEIVNALGMVVETQSITSLQAITAPNVAGVYTLRITVEGKGTCIKKLVVR